MEQTLKDLYRSLDRNLAPIANKENMTRDDVEVAYKAVCMMEKIKKIETMPSDRYSERYGYGYGASYPGHYPMSYDNDESMRRSRDAMGQFTSGHSFNDRMIARLETMYDETVTEHERERLRNEIEHLRRDPQ